MTITAMMMDDGGADDDIGDDVDDGGADDDNGDDVDRMVVLMTITA